MCVCWGGGGGVNRRDVCHTEQHMGALNFEKGQRERKIGQVVNILGNRTAT